MGTFVSMDVAITIPADKVEALTENLRAWFDRVSATSSLFQPPLAWSGAIEPGGPNDTLIDLIRACRYHAIIRHDGSVDICGFNGEKWGDDELFFERITPFVSTGTVTVICSTDAGEAWEYEIADGRLTCHQLVYQRVDNGVTMIEPPATRESQLRDALSLALQFVPVDAPDLDPSDRETIAKIHDLIGGLKP